MFVSHWKAKTFRQVWEFSQRLSKGLYWEEKPVRRIPSLTWTLIWWAYYAIGGHHGTKLLKNTTLRMNMNAVPQHFRQDIWFTALKRPLSCFQNLSQLLIAQGSITGRLDWQALCFFSVVLSCPPLDPILCCQSFLDPIWNKELMPSRDTCNIKFI